MTTAAVVLETRNLTIAFGGVNAVDDLTFAVPRHRLTSVIGPNGAGKSTLFNLLSGALSPTRGEIRFDERSITGWSPFRLRRVGLARSFQISNLFAECTVFENLRLAAQRLESASRLLRPVQQSKRTMARVDELLTQFELGAQTDNLAGELSHGEQRRLEIALCLADMPRLLLLDEPTQGMAQGDTLEIARIIRKLADQTSVMLIEHDIGLVMDISDRVVVLHQGRKLAEGSPDAIRANPEVRKAYLGEA